MSRLVRNGRISTLWWVRTRTLLLLKCIMEDIMVAPFVSRKDMEIGDYSLFQLMCLASDKEKEKDSMTFSIVFESDSLLPSVVKQPYSAMINILTPSSFCLFYPKLLLNRYSLAIELVPTYPINQEYWDSEMNIYLYQLILFAFHYLFVDHSFWYLCSTGLQKIYV